MTTTITTAPCCWGVDDVANPNLPPWTQVLDEASAAGYGGLELGPYGYVPLDQTRVSEALRGCGLFTVMDWGTTRATMPPAIRTGRRAFRTRRGPAWSPISGRSPTARAPRRAR